MFAEDYEELQQRALRRQRRLKTHSKSSQLWDKPVLRGMTICSRSVGINKFILFHRPYSIYLLIIPSFQFRKCSLILCPSPAKVFPLNTTLESLAHMNLDFDNVKVSISIAHLASGKYIVIFFSVVSVINFLHWQMEVWRVTCGCRFVTTSCVCSCR